MVQYHKENFIMSLSTFGEDEEYPGAFVVEYQKFQNFDTGLLKAHAYTILNVADLNGN